MVKHLYLMRHGQTLFNLQQKIQGWCDSPLTELGIKQAKAAGECLKDVDFDHYYCSTSERCSDTLEILTGYKVSYTRLKGLKERNFGSFEGEREYLNPKKDWDFTYDDLFPHYGGEFRKDVRERMINTLTDVMNKDDHKIVLAVSHAGACFSFFEVWENPDVISYGGGFTNCCILHFEFENNQFKFIEIIRPDVDC